MKDIAKFSSIFGLLLLAGCGNSARLIEQNAPELQARLDIVDAAVAEIETLPPLTQTTLQYDGPKLRMPQDGVETFDIGIVTLEAWNGEDDAASSNAWWRLIRECVADPRSRGGDSYDRVSQGVRQFLDARYALVIKKLAGSDPVVSESDIETMVSFTPGIYSGEAYMVDLATGDILGGYRFFATNSENPFIFGDAQSFLESNLRHEALRAAKTRLFGLQGELEFENLDDVTAAQAELMGIWDAPEALENGRRNRLRVTAERVHFEIVENNQPVGLYGLPMSISGEYELTDGQPKRIKFVDYNDHVWSGTYTLDNDQLVIDITPPALPPEGSEYDVAKRQLLLKTKYQRPYGELAE